MYIYRYTYILYISFLLLLMFVGVCDSIQFNSILQQRYLLNRRKSNSTSTYLSQLQMEGYLRFLLLLFHNI